MFPLAVSQRENQHSEFEKRLGYKKLSYERGTDPKKGGGGGGGGYV